MKREKTERMKNRIYQSHMAGTGTATCMDWKRLFSEKELQSLDRFYQGKLSCHFNGNTYTLRAPHYDTPSGGLLRYKIANWEWTEKYQKAEQIWKSSTPPAPCVF